jgi:hypothetical protein
MVFNLVFFIVCAIFLTTDNQSTALTIVSYCIIATYAIFYMKIRNFFRYMKNFLSNTYQKSNYLLSENRSKKKDKSIMLNQTFRIIRFFFKSVVIGFVTFWTFSLFTESSFFTTVHKHGVLEFSIACIFLGSIIIYFYRIYGPGPEFFATIKKELLSIEKVNKDNKTKQKSNNETDNYKDLVLAQIKNRKKVPEVPKEKKKSSFLESTSKGIVALAAYNVAARPIVIALNGATFHGASPKGMENWEILYSVPNNSVIQKYKVRRGVVGFNHGTYRFEIKWPSII